MCEWGSWAVLLHMHSTNDREDGKDGNGQCSPSVMVVQSRACHLQDQGVMRPGVRMVVGGVGSRGTHHLESGEHRTDGQVRGTERIQVSKGLTTWREGQVRTEPSRMCVVLQKKRGTKSQS